MKKIVSIFFILMMCATYLPAVLSYEQQKVVLFSTVEEEQPDHTETLKQKEALKVLPYGLFPQLTRARQHVSYSNLFILFAEDPCIGNHTPPPDWYC